KYADLLLDDLEDLDWTESLKEMQRNWIGRSEGAEVIYEIDKHDLEFEVFTTRPDTLFGATYAVFAPEHELVKKIVTKEHKEAVDAYIDEVETKSDIEGKDLADDKTGVVTGAYAIDHVNNERMAIWEI